MKTNIYATILSLLLFAGCSSKSSMEARGGDDYDFEGITLSRAQVKNSWMTSLSEKNPRLYLEVAKAMMASRKMNRSIYIHKDSTNGVSYYYMSLESGGGKDLIIADYPTKEIRFDHYNESDGPSMMDTEVKIWIDMKVQNINKEAGVADFK